MTNCNYHELKEFIRADSLESAAGAAAVGAAAGVADWKPEKSPKSPLALALGSTPPPAEATEVEEELFLG